MKINQYKKFFFLKLNLLKCVCCIFYVYFDNFLKLKIKKQKLISSHHWTFEILFFNSNHEIKIKIEESGQYHINHLSEQINTLRPIQKHKSYFYPEI